MTAAQHRIQIELVPRATVHGVIHRWRSDDLGDIRRSHVSPICEEHASAPFRYLREQIVNSVPRGEWCPACVTFPDHATREPR